MAKKKQKPARWGGTRRSPIKKSTVKKPNTYLHLLNENAINRALLAVLNLACSEHRSEDASHPVGYEHDKGWEHLTEVQRIISKRITRTSRRS